MRIGTIEEGTETLRFAEIRSVPSCSLDPMDYRIRDVQKWTMLPGWLGRCHLLEMFHKK